MRKRIRVVKVSKVDVSIEANVHASNRAWYAENILPQARINFHKLNMTWSLAKKTAEWDYMMSNNTTKLY